MPELPEVETIRRQLKPKIVGKTIIGVKIFCNKSFQGDPKKIIGRKVLALNRVGKQLVIDLSGNLVILVHFKMTGGFFFQPNKYTRVALYLSSPFIKQRKSTRHPAGNSSPDKKEGFEGFFFSDPRKFGWLKVLTKRSWLSYRKNLGIDILSFGFTPEYFYQQLQTSSRPIKQVLLDQTKMAGAGNIYANEALFLAKIHPLTSSKDIPRDQAYSLNHYLKWVIMDSISHNGSTARDRGYLQPNGQSGSHQNYFHVYQKEGEKCSTCSAKIKRLKIGGRSTFYCSKCQKIK